MLRVGAWTVDRAARTLAVDGADVPLTRTEFNIVELLALHPKKVYTKQELFELAWGEPYAAEDSTVSVHVSNIRAKLKPTGTTATSAPCGASGSSWRSTRAHDLRGKEASRIFKLS